MLIVGAPDTASVLYQTVRLASLVCCGLLVASFAMFARDQLAGASKHQQNELAAGASASASPGPVAPSHGQPRRFIDGAAKELTSPFDSILHSGNGWVERGLPTILALALYGFGLGYLARFSRGLT